MPVINVRHLSKSFSYYEKEAGIKNSFKNLFARKELEKHAVNDISFQVEEGESVGFIGPNGAGKTTTLKMLSGILHPSGGEATVLGYVPWERKKDFKMQISIVMGQKSQLWPDLPANETFELNRNIYEVEDKEYRSILEELTELLDVKDLLKVQVRRLSLGERMKMELIAALLYSPRLLFLDEPTIGLDIVSQKKIREFLKYYNQQSKTTILLTSHYMNDVEDLCKRSIIINDGEIVFDDELKKVTGIFNQKKILKLQVSDSVSDNDLERFGKVRSNDGVNIVLEVDRQQIKELSKAVWDTLPVIDLNIEDIPVEEGIALLYKKKETTL